MNTTGLWQYDELANVFISPDNRLFGIDDLLKWLNSSTTSRLTPIANDWANHASKSEYVIRNVEWFEDEEGLYWLGDLIKGDRKVGKIGNYYFRDEQPPCG